MANCGQASCGCRVEGGAGIDVSGSGSLDNPYRIELSDLGSTLAVQSTPTVALSLYGSGNTQNPYTISAVATVRVQDLTDVEDPEGAPAIGDTLVWVNPGTGEPARFEFRPPPANPGAVEVGDGVQGDGTLANPIELRLIGTSAGGPTTGQEVYVDSAGNLRATAPAVAAVSWDSITGKPANFPTTWALVAGTPASFPTTPASFTGILPVSKGGTGQDTLGEVKVGNSTLIDGRRIYVQSATPSGTIPVNSLWFW